MNFRTKILLVFITCLAVLNIAGQNLVPNGSFEEYTVCPENYSDNSYQSYVKFWDSPNKGTPDYFNSCSQSSGVPLNWMGYAETYHGNGYMGFIACMEQIDPKQIAYREYIRVELLKPLQKGVAYYASMQLQLGLSSIAACNGLGMFFSIGDLSNSGSVNYPIKSDIGSERIIDDKKNWTKICGSFVAEGGEKFLIIGNYLSNQQMAYKAFDENLIPTRQISPMAYYYVDDVQVLPFDSTFNYDCGSMNKPKIVAYDGVLEIDAKMILDNLYFEIDESVILKESYRELDQLAYQLRKNQHMKISIYGHTDDTGTEEYNQKLSEERAIAVRNYLLEKGVSKFRIATEGFGSSEPIEDNKTEEGRQQNRRVEIEVN